MHDNDNKKLFGTNMKRLRHEQGMTQEEFAFLVNMQPSSIGKIERGEANPTITTMTKIAHAFHLSLKAMLVDHDEETVTLYQKDIELKRIEAKKKRIVLISLKILNLLLDETVDFQEFWPHIFLMIESFPFTYYDLTVSELGGDETPPGITFGILAVLYQGGQKKQTMEIKDISLRKEEISELVDLLNHNFVSICHFEDVVCDFLNKQSFYKRQQTPETKAEHEREE